MRAVVAVLLAAAVAASLAQAAAPAAAAAKPGYYAGGQGGVIAVLDARGVLWAVAADSAGAPVKVRVAEGVVAAATWGPWVAFATSDGRLGLALVDADAAEARVVERADLNGSLRALAAGPWGVACALTATIRGTQLVYLASGLGARYHLQVPPVLPCPSLEPATAAPPGSGPLPIGLGWSVALTPDGSLEASAPWGAVARLYAPPEGWKPVALSTAPATGAAAGVAVLYATPQGPALVAVYARISANGSLTARIMGPHPLPTQAPTLGPAMVDPERGVVYAVVGGLVVEASPGGLAVRMLPENAVIVASNGVVAVARVGLADYTVLGAVDYWIRLLRTGAETPPLAPLAGLATHRGTALLVYKQGSPGLAGEGEPGGYALAAVTPRGVHEAELAQREGWRTLAAELPRDYLEVYASPDGEVYAPIPAPRPPPVTPPPAVSLLWTGEAPCKPRLVVDPRTGTSTKWPPSTAWLEAHPGPLGLLCDFNAAPTGILANVTAPRPARPQGSYIAKVYIIPPPQEAPPGVYGLAVAVGEGDAYPPPGTAITLQGPLGTAAVLEAPPPGSIRAAPLQAPCPEAACNATLALPQDTHPPPAAVFVEHRPPPFMPPIEYPPPPTTTTPPEAPTTPPPTRQPQASPAAHAALAAYTAMITALACRIASARAARQRKQ